MFIFIWSFNTKCTSVNMQNIFDMCKARKGGRSRYPSFYLLFSSEVFIYEPLFILKLSIVAHPYEERRGCRGSAKSCAWGTSSCLPLLDRILRCDLFSRQCDSVLVFPRQYLHLLSSSSSAKHQQGNDIAYVSVPRFPSVRLGLSYPCFRRHDCRCCSIPC